MVVVRMGAYIGWVGLEWDGLIVKEERGWIGGEGTVLKSVPHLCVSVVVLSLVMVHVALWCVWEQVGQVVVEKVPL